MHCYDRGEMIWEKGRDIQSMRFGIYTSTLLRSEECKLSLFQIYYNKTFIESDEGVKNGILICGI